MLVPVTVCSLHIFSFILGSILKSFQFQKLPVNFIMILFKKKEFPAASNCYFQGKTQKLCFLDYNNFCRLLVTYFYSQNIDRELRKCTENQFHLNKFACTFCKPPSRLT